MEALSLWLHQTIAGKILITLFSSMLPVLELRGGVPIGVALGLPIPVAFTAALIGNMIPVPFILLFARKIMKWVKTHISFCRRIIEKIEARAWAKSEQVLKYEVWGLLILVAIPLPGTGAWTGSLVAALLDMRLKKAVPTIFAGVVIAGIITTIVTYGVTLL